MPIAFIPDVPLIILPPGEEKTKAAALVAKLTSADEEVVRIAVDKAYNKEILHLHLSQVSEAQVPTIVSLP